MEISLLWLQEAYSLTAIYFPQCTHFSQQVCTFQSLERMLKEVSAPFTLTGSLMVSFSLYDREDKENSLPFISDIT